MNKTNQNNVKKIIGEVLGIASGEIENDGILVDMGMDSLEKREEIASALGRKFGVSFSEIDTYILCRVHDAYAMVEAKIHAV